MYGTYIYGTNSRYFSRYWISKSVILYYSKFPLGEKELVDLVVQTFQELLLVNQ